MCLDAVLPRDVLRRNRDGIYAVLHSYGVTEAGVFGSVARAEDTPDSDLDLIVHFADGVRRDLVGLTAALVAETGLNIDIVEDVKVFDRARATGVGVRILRETVPL